MDPRRRALRPWPATSAGPTVEMETRMHTCDPGPSIGEGKGPAMMYWNGNGAMMSPWGWALMAFGTVVFWAVVITAGVLLYRYVARGGGRAPQVSDDSPSPLQILAERYARGEITEDEYSARLTVLRHAPRH